MPAVGIDATACVVEAGSEGPQRAGDSGAADGARGQIVDSAGCRAGKTVRVIVGAAHDLPTVALENASRFPQPLGQPALARRGGERVASSRRGLPTLPTAPTASGLDFLRKRELAAGGGRHAPITLEPLRPSLRRRAKRRQIPQWFRVSLLHRLLHRTGFMKRCKQLDSGGAGNRRRSTYGYQREFLELGD